MSTTSITLEHEHRWQQRFDAYVFGAILALLLILHLYNLASHFDTTQLAGTAAANTVEEDPYANASIAPLANKIPASRIDPDALNPTVGLTEQERLNVAQHLATKYHRAPDEVRQYVEIARKTANETHIDPLLILSVMAVESNFDPDVESKAGAHGLMQVVTRIHRKTFALFGGMDTVFEPEANIRVGSYVLKQSIYLMGSLEGGLRYYVGASDPGYTDGGFVVRVFKERNELLELLGYPGNRKRLTATGIRPSIIKS